MATREPIRLFLLLPLGFLLLSFPERVASAHAGSHLVVTQVFGEARVRFPEDRMRREQQERVVP